MEVMEKVVAPLLVAMLWGLTTPFLREGSKGMADFRSEGQSWWRKHLRDIRFLLRWKYLIPFILNQCGSVLYVRVLGSDQLSLVVPLVNSLTLVFVFVGDVATSSTSFISYRSVAGLALILIGITVILTGHP